MSDVNQEALQRLQANLSRSLNIMKLDNNGAMNKMAQSHRSQINESIENGGAMPKLNTQYQKTKPSFNTNKSNLPKEIVESFKQNYIDPEGYIIEQATATAELLDGLKNNETRQQTTINEQQQTTTSTGVAQTIDYPTIRAIIEETIRKYVEPLQKQVINESKNNNNNLSLLTLGKNFKFVSKNGDIYEAKLTKIGNVNQK